MSSVITPFFRATRTWRTGGSAIAIVESLGNALRVRYSACVHISSRAVAMHRKVKTRYSLEDLHVVGFILPGVCVPGSTLGSQCSAVDVNVKE
jgi:hypothetical protein